MPTLSDRLCDCGCGQRTTLVEKTSRSMGRVKGEPNRFVYGHRPHAPARGPRLSDEERHASDERRREARRSRHYETYQPRGRRAARTPEQRRAARRAQWPRHREAKRIAEAARRARVARVFVEHIDPLVVLERDDGVCGICGGDVDPFDFHVDHVQPLALGGEHSYANVQAAHPACNVAKGASCPL